MMCFLSPFFTWIFSERFSTSPSWKLRRNMGIASQLWCLKSISSRSRHHQNLCSMTILKQFQLGFYIQMILLELRLLVPLDHTLCSVSLYIYIVGNGNISVPLLIHLCKFLLELHWPFPSNGSSSNRRGWLESTLEQETTLLDFSLMSTLVAMRKVMLRA